MVKKIFLTLIIATISLSAFASSPYKTGPYLRAGVGPDNFNVGIGYYFTEHFSFGVEATSVNGFGGYGGVADARLYLGNSAIRPFADIKGGYGFVGKNVDYSDINGFVGSAMLGLGWRRIDLGAGVSYDAINKVMPTVNVSYSLPLRRK